jgi:hypothetical protein
MKTPRELVNESSEPLDVVDVAAMLGERRFHLVNYLLIIAQDLEYALTEAHELDEEIPPTLNGLYATKRGERLRSLAVG